MGNPAPLLSLLQNSALLLAMVVIHAFVRSRFGGAHARDAEQPLAVQLFTGLLMGLTGIAIVLTPVSFPSGVLLDTRSVLLSLTGLFFGWIPLLVTMLVTAAVKAWLVGPLLWNGIIVMICAGGLGLAWRHLLKPDLKRLPYGQLYLFGLLVHAVVLCVLYLQLRGVALDVLSNVAWPVLLVFPLVTVLVGKLLAYFLRADTLLHELHESEQRLRANMLARVQDEENLKVFRALIDNTKDSIEVVDPFTGRFLDVNVTGCRELGYSREELLGMRIFDVDPTVVPATFFPGVAALKHGDSHCHERMHRRKDGSLFPVEVNIRFVQLNSAYLVSVVRNISERRQTDEALRLAALVYQNSREAMMVTDADTRIIDVNPTFTTITGYEKEEVLGKTPAILKSQRHSGEFYRAMWADLHATGHWSGEIWNKRKNGEIFPERLEINAACDAAGKVQRWVAQFTDISEMKAAQAQIWEQANFDSLTGLPNRSMFQDRLQQEIKHAQRAGTRVALLFLDLDHFKEVNDTLGHDMGDLLLQQVATRLRASVRDSDTIARLGGDEFIIILGGLSDSALVGTLAQKVLDALAAPFDLKVDTVYVSASIGITLYPDDGQRPEVLLKNADQAMYTAKKTGRNRYYHFTAEMQEHVDRRMRVISELRLALAAGQFRVVYQPIVELATGRVSKAEALVRWEHPVEGLISPASFIPLAEDSGLITPIGNMVFREAAHTVARLRATYPDFTMSVNKSPAQFDSKQHDWVDYIQQSGLDGTSLVVEITEGLLLDARPAVQQQLNELRRAGLKMALDDFGTGYSSLAYLKKFAISYLKIDQGFVRNLAAGNQDQAMCEAMITMAHLLGMTVIAEGVEAAAQRDILLSAGCDYGQGFLFAEPLTCAELEDYLAMHGVTGGPDFPQAP